jgi:hypothetical protein
LALDLAEVRVAVRGGRVSRRDAAVKASSTRRKRAKASAEGGAEVGSLERCELCGKPAQRIGLTECCGRRVCYKLKYGVFVSKQSCLERHARLTLCAAHHAEGHAGEWRTCVKCRESFETEMYVYYGTNKYNFEKLQDPPAYELTLCVGCGRVIVLSKDAYTLEPSGSYRCGDCWED